MFSSFTNRLLAEVETIKLVLDAHESLRALVYPRDPGEVPSETPNPAEAPPSTDVANDLDEIRRSGLSKPSWQVYDHCAAFTRLYAVYEQFVEDLASDYLRILPDLYKKYVDLPPNVRKQHRIGIGQILMKLGKDGPYKELDEGGVIKGWSDGLAGNTHYKLLPDAFLIDPQNYRAEILAGLFRYLGIEDCWAWIENHPLVLEFMARERDANETPKTLLHDFVEYRNKASHTKVGEIVATEEIKSIADYVAVLSQALSQLVMKRVVQQKTTLGEAVRVGRVLNRFSNFIVGAQMAVGTVARGDELVVIHKNSCYRAEVMSIQIQQSAYERLDVQEGQEIGLQLSERANKGAELVRITGSPTPAGMIPEPISPDDYPIQAVPQVADQDDP
jgi:MAE_28990/MAE_18760-like HEPN